MTDQSRHTCVCVNPSILLDCFRCNSFPTKFVSDWDEQQEQGHELHSKYPQLRNIIWVKQTSTYLLNLAQPWVKVRLTTIGKICAILFIFAYKLGCTPIHPKSKDGYAQMGEHVFGWNMQALSRFSRSASSINKITCSISKDI